MIFFPFSMHKNFEEDFFISFLFILTVVLYPTTALRYYSHFLKRVKTRLPDHEFDISKIRGQSILREIKQNKVIKAKSIHKKSLKIVKDQ